MNGALAYPEKDIHTLSVLNESVESHHCVPFEFGGDHFYSFSESTRSSSSGHHSGGRSSPNLPDLSMTFTAGHPCLDNMCALQVTLSENNTPRLCEETSRHGVVE